MSKKPITIILISMIFVLAVGMACSLSKRGDPTATPVPPTEETAVVIPTQETAEATKKSEPVAEEVSKTEGGLSLLTKQAYIQDDSSLSTFIYFRNDDPDNVMHDIEYTIHVYDSSGNQLQNDTTTIGLIAPGETIGMVNEIYLDEGETAYKFEVDWIIESKESTSGYVNPFSYKNAKYYDDDGWKYLTGVIVNNDDITYTDVRVSAIALDASGEILGGGYSYADFIPSEDQVGVSAFSTIDGEPVSVEFYPMLYSWSTTYEDGDWWNNIEVGEWGFVQNGTEIGGGAFLTNVTDKLLKDTQYMLTVYDPDGNVCAVDSGKIHYIFPGETLGFSPGATYVPSTSSPDAVDLIIMPGEFAEHELANSPYITENFTFNYDEFWSSISLDIRNTYTKGLSEGIVYVLLLDANGDVIGGGNAYLESIGEDSVRTVEMFVTYAEKTDPASIVVYPTITTWTEIQ